MVSLQAFPRASNGDGSEFEEDELAALRGRLARRVLRRGSTHLTGKAAPGKIHAQVMGKKSGGGMPHRQKQRQLLDSESNWLDPQLERVLLEIFQHFDGDTDGALNEAELQAFAGASNGDGSEFEEDELEQISEYFETTDAGALTKSGFFQMFHLQCTSRPQDTWNDLANLGYDRSLTLKSQQGMLNESVADAVAAAMAGQGGSAAAASEDDEPDNADEPDAPAEALSADAASGADVEAAAKKRAKNRAKKLKQKAKKEEADAAAAFLASSEQKATTAGSRAADDDDAGDEQIAEREPEPAAGNGGGVSESGGGGIVLGYWNTRALAQDLRAMLIYKGVSFEDRRYAVGPPPLYDKSHWYDDKETLGLAFPNLPFLLDADAGVKISQHQTIQKYLGRKLGLTGGGTVGAELTADMATEAATEWSTAFCGLTYSSYVEYSGRKDDYVLTTLPYHAKRFEAILSAQPTGSLSH